MKVIIDYHCPLYGKTVDVEDILTDRIVVNNSGAFHTLRLDQFMIIDVDKELDNHIQILKNTKATKADKYIADMHVRLIELYAMRNRIMLIYPKPDYKTTKL